MLKFILIAYFVWLLLLFVFQERLIFPGWTMRFGELPLPPGGESLWIEPADGVRVEAWFVPGVGCTADNPGPLVVFAHGNAEMIDEWPYLAQRYHEWGVSMLIPEYRGFGRSGGSPGQQAITADFVEFFDRVIEKPEIDRERVFYHGRSIGTAVVCQLAGQRPPRAMILESPFTSLTSMTVRYLAPSFLLRHPFRSDRVVAELDAPILILHGTRDTIVPISHGRKLHEMAKNSEMVEFSAGHNDMPVETEEYWRPVERFLREHGFVK